MNRHIERLVEQAPFTTISTEGRLFTQQDLAKFAELILRECMLEFKMAKVRDYASDEYDSGYDAGLQEAIEVIKEHFGVEE